MRYLNLLLIFAPIAIIGSFLHVPETWLFIASALAVIPVAGILGARPRSWPSIPGRGWVDC